MDVVEAAAVVLAALEVAPSKPADLTPLVADLHVLQTLMDAPDQLAPHVLARSLAPLIDHRRITYWIEMLRRNMSRAGQYRPVLAGQPDYPRRLGEVRDAPPLLFVRGTLPNPDVLAVAMIGSRATDEDTLAATNENAYTLAAAGINVVSGLALGVDGAAHHGALRANGHTTAVLGTGIEVVFPSQHSELAEIVGQQGAILSEFSPQAPPTNTSFLRRNGTIAGMSDILVVMDAATRSGSRQAVGRAVEYGRPVMMWEPMLGHHKWSNDLASAGSGQFFNESTQLLDAVQKIAQ